MKISRREKVFLGVGGTIAVLFVLIGWVMMPLLDKRADLHKAVSVKEQQLQQMYGLGADIKDLERTTRGSQAAVSGDFTLFGYLEDLAKKGGINERIEYMKPLGALGGAKESVEVKIRGIYEVDLIGLLYGVETNPHGLRIKRINVRRVDRDNNLDVTFQVVYYG